MANSIAVELEMENKGEAGIGQTTADSTRRRLCDRRASIAGHVVRRAFDAIGAGGDQSVTVVGRLNTWVILKWTTPWIAEMPLLKVRPAPPRLGSRRRFIQCGEPLLAGGVTANINFKGIECKFQCGQIRFAHSFPRITASTRRELITYACTQDAHRDQRCNHCKDYYRPARPRSDAAPVVLQYKRLATDRQYTTAFDHALLHAPACEIVAANHLPSMQFCALCCSHLSEVASIPN